MGMKGVAVADRDELMQRFASALDAIPDEVLAEAEVDDVERAGVRVAAYFMGDGKVTTLSSAGNGCPTKTILDVAGSSVTGANGMVEVRLNNFHCVDRPVLGGGDNALGYESPIHLVATARSGNMPCFVTVQTERDTAGANEDVIIRLFSWDAGGNPLGRIRVQWRCMVPTFTIIG
jgi:hypothetical protein